MRLGEGVARIMGWKQGRARARTLAEIRSRLHLRGMKVDQMSDAELETVISTGRDALTRAGVRGSDITAAFVTLARADVLKQTEQASTSRV